MYTRSGVRINPTWAPGVVPLFVGYRTRAGGDLGVGDGVAGKVLLYSAATAGSYDTQETALLATLSGERGGHQWVHVASMGGIRAL